MISYTQCVWTHPVVLENTADSERLLILEEAPPGPMGGVLSHVFCRFLSGSASRGVAAAAAERSAVVDTSDTESTEGGRLVSSAEEMLVALVLLLGAEATTAAAERNAELDMSDVEADRCRSGKGDDALALVT